MYTREHKGKSLIAFPNDFTIVDLETTGLSPDYDSIIEIAALRVRNSIIDETFHSLIKLNWPLSSFITALTGITDDMLKDAPELSNVLPKLKAFIGDDIIVGHNVNFDINFLYDNFERVMSFPLTNDFIDTMRIARKALPELKHHRLIDVAETLNVSPDEQHRALGDCKTTFNCFYKLYDMITASGSIEEFIDSFKRKRKYSSYLDLSSIVADNEDFDETHPLYGKVCVFTGKLEKMTRKEAVQYVVNHGGTCKDSAVTKDTNYLILSNEQYSKSLSGKITDKQKKAEEFKLKGLDIEILSEDTFYSLLEY